MNTLGLAASVFALIADAFAAALRETRLRRRLGSHYEGPLEGWE